MNVLILDGYNLLHRAYHGNRFGQFHTIFNFFRSLRPIVEKFNPDHAYFVLEGRPVGNVEALPSYKSNRGTASDTFNSHKHTCLDLLTKHFPIEVIRHPNFEADDVVGALARHWHLGDNVTVISSDTDFIQLLNEFETVQLYDPIRKKFAKTPDYDYVTWKALRGDPADSIPGIPGVGDKTATKMIHNSSLMESKLSKDNNRQIFERNLKLIKFDTLDGEMESLEVSTPWESWDDVRSVFAGFEFNSIVNDKSWNKFTSTFENLWNERS